ncbi:MAG: Clp protease N-terminal domain-containing protein [Thermoguttaceae bacterium]|jgi:ATP-dependent Clp protease ATP-binding subunit ClpC
MVTWKSELFTFSFGKALVLAQEEANRLACPEPNTEHLLIGMIREGGGVAADVLDAFGVGLEKVRPEVEHLIRQRDASLRTPRAREVLVYSVEEMRFHRHDLVGTGHLLLGVVHETAGGAAQVLRHLGLELDGIRQEVENRFYLGMEDPG